MQYPEILAAIRIQVTVELKLYGLMQAECMDYEAVLRGHPNIKMRTICNTPHRFRSQYRYKIGKKDANDFNKQVQSQGILASGSGKLPGGTGLATWNTPTHPVMAAEREL